MNKRQINLAKAKTFLLITLLMCLGGISTANAGQIINGYSFDLTQFVGATVTYRDPGGVTFDGKLWDNANGVDGVTLGELAAGQFGSDPGDQVSLNDRTTPDWLQLNYSTPILISPTSHELVIYEITSSTSGVDTEGTSFKVKFNGGGLIEASAATSISHFPNVGAEEDTNQLVFDLYNFGFSDGQFFSTLYIENKDTGSSTSDPDFIFAGIAGELGAAVPEPSSTILLTLGLLGLIGRGLVRRKV